MTTNAVFVQGAPAPAGYPALAPEAERGRVLRVTVVGEEILRRPCKAADTEFGTAELARLIDDMFVTMYVAEGAGLAANQVDVDLRLFVYDCRDDAGVRHVGHVLNPVVETPALQERRLIEAPQACLSVPGPRADLHREDRATVRGRDQDGNEIVIEGTGYFARCLRHETDHLNGLLYIDRLAKRRRRAVLDEMNEVMDDVFRKREVRARQIGAAKKEG